MGGKREEDVREAKENLAADRAEHDRQMGRLPDTRGIDRWAGEIARRNDRRFSERGNRRTRGK